MQHQQPDNVQVALPCCQVQGRAAILRPPHACISARGMRS